MNVKRYHEDHGKDDKAFVEIDRERVKNGWGKEDRKNFSKNTTILKWY